MEHKRSLLLFTRMLMQMHDSYRLQGNTQAEFIEKCWSIPGVKLDHVKFTRHNQLTTSSSIADPRYDSRMTERPEGYHSYYEGFMSGAKTWNKDIETLSELVDTCGRYEREKSYQSPDEKTCRRVIALVRSMYGFTQLELYRNIDKQIAAIDSYRIGWEPSTTAISNLAKLPAFDDIKKLSYEVDDAESREIKENHKLYLALYWYDTLLHESDCDEYPEKDASAELCALGYKPDVGGFSRLTKVFEEKKLEKGLCSWRFRAIEAKKEPCATEKASHYVRGKSDGLDAQSSEIKTSRDLVKKTLLACDTMHDGMSTNVEALEFLQRYGICPKKLCGTVISTLREDSRGYKTADYLNSLLKPNSSAQ